MMNIKIKNSFIYVLLLAFIAFNCQDDEKFADIDGKWVGDKSQISIYLKGIPIAFYDETNDDFNGEVEFSDDGTLYATFEDQESEGSWEWVQLNKKIALTANFGFDFIGPTETFTIKKLTEENLVIYLEKEDSFVDPDSQQEFTGTIEATFYFKRQP